MEVKQAYCFDDVLLEPKRSTVISRNDVNLSVDLGNNIKLAIPIVSANMKNITGSQMARVISKIGGLGLLHRFCTIDEQIEMFELTKPHENRVGISVGVQEESMDRAKKLIDKGCKIVCIDVAHGHSKLCLDMTLKLANYILNNKYNVLLISGNVATRQGAAHLANNGANVVKVGVGSGSLCSTRIEAGVGVPQLSALEDCYNCDGRIKTIADGGIRRAGDCVKALVFSDAVMLGNVLAGTDEAPGNIVTMNGVRYKEYEGSSTHKSKHIEGVKGLVQLKGGAEPVVQKLLEGIRSGCSYQGAKNLEELKINPKFVSISAEGLKESHPHDIIVR